MLKVTSTEQFELPGTDGRMIHCGEITNTRFPVSVYLCLYDIRTHKKYIEEITTGKLKVVEDDDRWQELSDFAELHDIFPAFIKK